MVDLVLCFNHCICSSVCMYCYVYTHAYNLLCDLFFSLNPQLFQQPVWQDCLVLSVFNLSEVVACHWVKSFIPCLRRHSTISNALNTGSGLPFIDLHNVTCVQHVLGEDFHCSCQMDCLFSFKGTNGESVISAYAYLAAISCNASKVDEVKAYLNSPQTPVLYVNGSTPFVPCNIIGKIALFNTAFTGINNSYFVCLYRRLLTANIHRSYVTAFTIPLTVTVF